MANKILNRKQYTKGKVETMWISHGVGDYQTSESRCVIVCPWHNFEFDLDTGLSASLIASV
ncbi:MAG: hypothetical protein JOZ19_12045 [Rubrobacter sp.]|nr:hypothetical protein [Rubrobacter sp.]